MFFSFLAVFPLPESYQNDPKFHFNTLSRSDTQKSSKKVENTTRGWSRCEIVFGPPPPAKADIATAILTNVIEHLVLLLPPNKHAFTAKAVWADLLISWWLWHTFFSSVPSGELTFCYGKSQFLMGKSTISMAIFNCYVSPPEGIQNWPWIGYEGLGGEARRHGMSTFDGAWVSRWMSAGFRTTACWKIHQP